MKTFLIAIFTCLSFVGHGAGKKSDLSNVKADSLPSIIKSERDSSEYIHLSLSKLNHLYLSLRFNNEESLLSETKNLGFSTNGGTLYAKQLVLDKHPTDKIPMGFFMCERLPVLIAMTIGDHSGYWISYTFPIDYLCYYKRAILGSEVEFGEQRVRYSDQYDTYYVEEKYVSATQEIKYTLAYTSDYCNIEIENI